ncbi:MAG: hypothetical protein ACRDMV_25260 [Streptosporangiales bacterium]
MHNRSRLHVEAGRLLFSVRVGRYRWGVRRKPMFSFGCPVATGWATWRHRGVSRWRVQRVTRPQLADAARETEEAR